MVFFLWALYGSENAKFLKITIFVCFRVTSESPFEYFGPIVKATFCFQDDNRKCVNNYI